MPQPCYLRVSGLNQGFITRNAGASNSVGVRLAMLIERK